MTTSDQ